MNHPRTHAGFYEQQPHHVIIQPGAVQVCLGAVEIAKSAPAGLYSLGHLAEKLCEVDLKYQPTKIVEKCRNPLFVKLHRLFDWNHLPRIQPIRIMVHPREYSQNRLMSNEDCSIFTKLFTNLFFAVRRPPPCAWPAVR